MAWTREEAEAFTTSAKARQGRHSESLRPRGDEVRVFFTRDHANPAECPWCLAGGCTQKVRERTDGALLVEHGYRTH